ncbi:MAG: amidohydrolase family protein [Betaproteobacteria bacterium]|nr:amidohydrolase family protein [Betaproteobacteria bacterium]
MHDLVIRNACPWGTGAAAKMDIAMDGGRVAAVAVTIAGRGREEWDAGGRLLLPGLVEPHLHLDKACLADVLGGAVDLVDARTRFARLRPALTPRDLVQRGRRVIEWAIRHGVAALRTHADVDRIVGLRHVEAALELKEMFADRVAVQVVAFQPASVPLDDEASWRMLEDALGRGCDAVGGTTGSRGPEASALMTRMLELAVRVGSMVDLHVDETLDPAVQNLPELARLTRRFGLQGRVTASHCCSLSVTPAAARAETIRLIAEAQIHVIALPLTNLYLQGRDSGLRGVAPVAELLAGEVNVACGSDNVQDPFLPVGNADPLLAAQVLGLAGQLADSRYLLESVSSRAAAAMGISVSPDWCTAGAAASFSVADCGPADDPVACLPPRPLVVFNGRVVRKPGDGTHDLPPIRTH